MEAFAPGVPAKAAAKRSHGRKPAGGKRLPQRLARRPAAPPAKRARKAAASRTGGKARADKGEGNKAVRRLLAGLPAWQRAAAEDIDRIVGREVPDARRAVKWGAAFYGVSGQGWFASVKGFSRHVKLTFFRGTSLTPVPPSGEHAQGRSLDVREGDRLDEAQVAAWVRQASQLPGWGNA